MADTGVYATTQEIQDKAGANASVTSKAEAYTNRYVAQVESFINCATRRNWSDDYAALNADVKKILSEAASNLAAIYVIEYDMSGFTTRLEAESMINVLYARAMDCIDVLKDPKVESFMDAET